MTPPGPPPPPGAAALVVMGVAGAGKSVVGAALARRLGVAFGEGDALHPATNVARMAAGYPLDDADRWPWLERVADWLVAHPGGVASCSALRRRYRDFLRGRAGAPPAPVRLGFVLLDPPPAVLAARLAARAGHFMPPALLASQLATLERPGSDERALVLAEPDGPAALVDAAARWWAAATSPPRR